MHKSIVIASIFLIIYWVNGERDPNLEIDHVDTVTDTQTKEFKKIADEINKLRNLLESTKRNMADGLRSDSNINELLAMPKKIANLTHRLQSTINAMEKKELLA